MGVKSGSVAVAFPEFPQNSVPWSETVWSTCQGFDLTLAIAAG